METDPKKGPQVFKKAEVPEENDLTAPVSKNKSLLEELPLKSGPGQYSSCEKNNPGQVSSEGKANANSFGNEFKPPFGNEFKPPWNPSTRIRHKDPFYQDDYFTTRKSTNFRLRPRRNLPPNKTAGAKKQCLEEPGSLPKEPQRPLIPNQDTSTSQPFFHSKQSVKEKNPLVLSGEIEKSTTPYSETRRISPHRAWTLKSWVSGKVSSRSGLGSSVPHWSKDSSHKSANTTSKTNSKGLKDVDSVQRLGEKTSQVSLPWKIISSIRRVKDHPVPSITEIASIENTADQFKQSCDVKNSTISMMEPEDLEVPKESFEMLEVANKTKETKEEITSLRDSSLDKQNELLANSSIGSASGTAINTPASIKKVLNQSSETIGKIEPEGVLGKSEKYSRNEERTEKCSNSSLPNQSLAAVHDHSYTMGSTPLNKSSVQSRDDQNLMEEIQDVPDNNVQELREDKLEKSPLHDNLGRAKTSQNSAESSVCSNPKSLSSIQEPSQNKGSHGSINDTASISVLEKPDGCSISPIYKMEGPNYKKIREKFSDENGSQNDQVSAESLMGSKTMPFVLNEKLSSQSKDSCNLTKSSSTMLKLKELQNESDDVVICSNYQQETKKVLKKGKQKATLEKSSCKSSKILTDSVTSSLSSTENLKIFQRLESSRGEISPMYTHKDNEELMHTTDESSIAAKIKLLSSNEKIPDQTEDRCAIQDSNTINASKSRSQDILPKLEGVSKEEMDVAFSLHLEETSEKPGKLLPYNETNWKGEMAENWPNEQIDKILSEADEKSGISDRSTSMQADKTSQISNESSVSENCNSTNDDTEMAKLRDQETVNLLQKLEEPGERETNEPACPNSDSIVDYPHHLSAESSVSFKVEYLLSSNLQNQTDDIHKHDNISNLRSEESQKEHVNFTPRLEADTTKQLPEKLPSHRETSIEEPQLSSSSVDSRTKKQKDVSDQNESPCDTTNHRTITTPKQEEPDTIKLSERWEASAETENQDQSTLHSDNSYHHVLAGDSNESKKKSLHKTEVLIQTEDTQNLNKAMSNERSEDIKEESKDIIIQSLRQNETEETPDNLFQTTTNKAPRQASIESFGDTGTNKQSTLINLVEALSDKSKGSCPSVISRTMSQLESTLPSKGSEILEERRNIERQVSDSLYGDKKAESQCQILAKHSAFSEELMTTKSQNSMVEDRHSTTADIHNHLTSEKTQNELNVYSSCLKDGIREGTLPSDTDITSEKPEQRSVEFSVASQHSKLDSVAKLHKQNESHKISNDDIKMAESRDEESMNSSQKFEEAGRRETKESTTSPQSDPAADTPHQFSAESSVSSKKENLNATKIRNNTDEESRQSAVEFFIGSNTESPISPNRQHEGLCGSTTTTTPKQEKQDNTKLPERWEDSAETEKQDSSTLHSYHHVLADYSNKSKKESPLKTEVPILTEDIQNLNNSMTNERLEDINEVSKHATIQPLKPNETEETSNSFETISKEMKQAPIKSLGCSEMNKQFTVINSVEELSEACYPLVSKTMNQLKSIVLPKGSEMLEETENKERQVSDSLHGNKKADSECQGLAEGSAPSEDLITAKLQNSIVEDNYSPIADDHNQLTSEKAQKKLKDSSPYLKSGISKGTLPSDTDINFEKSEQRSAEFSVDSKFCKVDSIEEQQNQNESHKITNDDIKIAESRDEESMNLSQKFEEAGTRETKELTTSPQSDSAADTPHQFPAESSVSSKEENLNATKIHNNTGEESRQSAVEFSIGSNTKSSISPNHRKEGSRGSTSIRTITTPKQEEQDTTKLLERSEPTSRKDDTSNKESNFNQTEGILSLSNSMSNLKEGSNDPILDWKTLKTEATPNNLLLTTSTKELGESLVDYDTEKQSSVEKLPESYYKETSDHILTEPFGTSESMNPGLEASMTKELPEIVPSHEETRTVAAHKDNRASEGINSYKSGEQQEAPGKSPQNNLPSQVIVDSSLGSMLESLPSSEKLMIKNKAIHGLSSTSIRLEMEGVQRESDDSYHEEDSTGENFKRLSTFQGNGHNNKALLKTRSASAIHGGYVNSFDKNTAASLDSKLTNDKKVEHTGSNLCSLHPNRSMSIVDVLSENLTSEKVEIHSSSCSELVPMLARESAV